MSKKKNRLDKRWLENLSPESTRPKQILKLPQNNGNPHISFPDMNTKKNRKKMAANRVIMSAYRALGRKQAQHHSIEMIARELVALKNLKIDGPIDKYSVAAAIDPEYLTKKSIRPDRTIPRRITLGSNEEISESSIKAFYASWEWKRLSYDVKQERGRACECCGAKAPHVRIITDHIKPLRKYWHLRLEKTNLQVLCDDCNMGKGSRDETDFRALNAEDVWAPTELEMTEEEELRLSAIRDQLRIN